MADGPSSSLTIDTDDVPLGSYTMDIVIYHYRGREKFIPMGYASTQFSITGGLRVIEVLFVEKVAQSLNSLSCKNLTTSITIKSSSVGAQIFFLLWCSPQIKYPLPSPWTK